MGHSYYIGRSGSGKSTLMLTHIIDAIEAGHGVFYLDPHGDDTDTLLNYIPPRRRKDVILFDPSDQIISYNPLDVDADWDQVAESLLYSLRDIWRYSGSTPTFDEYVLHSLLTLQFADSRTLLGVKSLLTSPSYRKSVLDSVTDKHLLSFWNDYEKLTPKEQRDEIRSTKNKFNTIIADKRLRRTLGQKVSAFSMNDVLEGNILLARLPQGELGINKTRLLGMLMLSQAQAAAMNRTSTEPFHIFIDEAHNFQGMALMEMLSGIRKFDVQLHVAHQYLKQLTLDMRDALMGNCENRYVFRVTRPDAVVLDEDVEFDNTTPKFFELQKFHYRLGKEVLFAEKLPEPKYVDAAHRTREQSRHRFAKSAEQVDWELDRFFDST